VKAAKIFYFWELAILFFYFDLIGVTKVVIFFRVVHFLFCLMILNELLHILVFFNYLHINSKLILTYCLNSSPYIKTSFIIYCNYFPST